jgi:hypothetical protein
MNYIKEILVNLVRSTLMTKFADLDQAEKRRISFEKNRKAKDLPQIIIIRHAKSDWSSFNSDFERGLNERGYRSCEIISRELKKKINLPDKFLISPAKRAQLTFEEIFFSWFQNKSIFQNHNFLFQIV